MALISRIEDCKKYLPVSLDMDISSILPFVKKAEREFIIPVIGQEQYNAINTAYTDASMTTQQKALLPFLQEAITHYAFYLWIPVGQLHIDDSGIRIANTDTLKTAFQWQIDELQATTLKLAYSALDACLEFMELNKADYPIWAASTYYTLTKDSFINSAKEFTTYYSALGNSRINYMAMRSIMKKVEDFIIKPNLGAAFYSLLKAEISGDALSIANKKIINNIQAAIVNYTINRAITELSVSVDAMGVFMFINTSGANQKIQAAPSYLSKIENSTQADGNAYLELVRKYLFDNIADYPTYATVYNAATTDTTFKNVSTNTFYFAG